MLILQPILLVLKPSLLVLQPSIYVCTSSKLSCRGHRSFHTENTYTHTFPAHPAAYHARTEAFPACPVAYPACSAAYLAFPAANYTCSQTYPACSDGKPLSSTFFVFACAAFKHVWGRKRETVFAHIVWGVYFEGARNGFLLKYKQKTKKDEPAKTKKDLHLSSSFWVFLSSIFAYTSVRNQFSPLKMDTSHNVSEDCFLFLFSVKFNWNTSKTKKVEESLRKRFAIPSCLSFLLSSS